MAKTLTMARYQALCRKLARSYADLDAVYVKSEYYGQLTIARALDGIATVPDALRIQVCDQCKGHGYYEKPDDPYTSYGCSHDGVPYFNIKDGTWRTQA